ncbi:MAG: flagellar motor protein [Bdellovibrionaceae bacterium]|nr:flagellar motor protein [Pseudobdellovibrionaceae bacterium]
MDKATWTGLLIGFGGILLANTIDGGELSSLVQGTAALIVLSGTFGAVLVSNSSKDIKRGFRLASEAFEHKDSDIRYKITEMVDYARTARKESLVALEPKIPKASDLFIKEILKNVVDGTDATLIKEIFEAKIDSEEHELLSAAKIWSDAGGFAPTVGILGAVLGLIHVMGNLSDTSKLGAGIAVAFVATIYGVGFANLLFIPLNNKIKKNISQRMREKRVLLEGGALINSSLNPLLIDQKLKALVEEVQ